MKSSQTFLHLLLPKFKLRNTISTLVLLLMIETPLLAENTLFVKCQSNNKKTQLLIMQINNSTVQPAMEFWFMPELENKKKIKEKIKKVYWQPVETRFHSEHFTLVYHRKQDQIYGAKLITDLKSETNLDCIK